MLFKEILDVYDLLENRNICGKDIKKFFSEFKEAKVDLKTIKSVGGQTDYIRIYIEGLRGKFYGGQAPTLGIIGRLGALGSWPDQHGLVSDADGAIAAISIAYKLLKMQAKGDYLQGDVEIVTHICPSAPAENHGQVSFMGLPVEIDLMNKEECNEVWDAVISIDATKGNKVINQKGFAISPIVKEGYILPASEDILDIMEIVTGKAPVVFPITTQDITPYDNGLYHINSIMQPSTHTKAPVMGVAITSQVMISGNESGANNPMDIEGAGRFVLEVAKRFSENKCEFYDEKEFLKLLKLYGKMDHLQK